MSAGLGEDPCVMCCVPVPCPGWGGGERKRGEGWCCGCTTDQGKVVCVHVCGRGWYIEVCVCVRARAQSLSGREVCGEV